MASFVKVMRSEQAAFLDHHPNANHLLNVIARRARRTKCHLNQLEIGECFISFRSVGMTEQQYRTAKKQLQKWVLVEFKKGRRVTDKGTVALLLNSSIYDINVTKGNGSVTEDQRKGNGKLTTNKECKNVNNEKECKKEDIPDKPDAPKFNFKNELLSLGVDKQILDDWFEVRKAKKARNTKTAFDALIKQITESGLMVNDAIKFATEENWAGFKSAWYFNKQPAQGGAGQAKQYSDVTAQNINTIGEWLNE